MAKIVYSLRKKKDTEEYHLFECSMSEPINCNCKKNSICGKMEKDEQESTVFSCQTDDYSRKEIANIGRDVCGVCVSHLYETYE